MKRDEVRKLCQEVREGRFREVEHLITHQHGEVVACEGTMLEVKTGERYQRWAGENCERP